MRGEIPSRGDTFVGLPRSIGSKEITTPGTPGTTMRHPPTYQRMHSTESKASDKDPTGSRD